MSAYLISELQPMVDSLLKRIKEDKDFGYRSENISFSDNTYTCKLRFYVYNQAHEGYGFTIDDMPTGCGLIVMYAIGKIDKYIADFVEEVLQLYAKYGAGTCIATMGDDYLGKYEFKDLSLWNFKELSTYPNFRHDKDGSYKQKLYQHLSTIKLS